MDRAAMCFRRKHPIACLSTWSQRNNQHPVLYGRLAFQPACVFRGLNSRLNCVRAQDTIGFAAGKGPERIGERGAVSSVIRLQLRNEVAVYRP